MSNEPTQPEWFTIREGLLIIQNYRLRLCSVITYRRDGSDVRLWQGGGDEEYARFDALDEDAAERLILALDGHFTK